MKILSKVSIIIPLAVLTFGCSSLPSEIQKLTDAGNFKDAKQLLEEEGLAQTVAPELNQEKKSDLQKLEARKLYSDKVEEHYIPKVESALQQGNALKALSIVKESKDLCIWSKKIIQQFDRINEIVDKLDGLQKFDAEKVSGSSDSPKFLRSFLEQAKSVYPYMADHPQLKNAVEAANRSLGKHWFPRIEQDLREKEKFSLTQFKSDISLLKLSDKEKGELVNVADSLASLPTEASSATFKIDGVRLNKISEIILEKTKLNNETVHGYYLAYDKSLMSWLHGPLEAHLNGANPSYDSLETAEDLHSAFRDLSQTTFRGAVAAAHLKHAMTQSARGLEAALGLVHLARYRQLAGDNVNEAEAKKVGEQCRVTLKSCDDLSKTISIVAKSGADAKSVALIKTHLMTALQAQTKPHAAWVWPSSPEVIKTDFAVNLESIVKHLPSEEKQLRSVSSSYLARMDRRVEQRPNPEKASMQRELQSKQSSMRSKERSYQNAVDTYRRNPTESNRGWINHHQIFYRQAVDEYNRLVGRYNSMPNTIGVPVQVPVYQNYSYKEGTLLQGWEIKGNIVINETKAVFSASKIDKDLVRKGTNPKDRNNRRDDPVNIKLGTEQNLKNLSQVCEQMAESIGKASIGIHGKELGKLAEKEKRIINCAVHPFGVSQSLISQMKLPEWAGSVILGVKLPSLSGEVNQ